MEKKIITIGFDLPGYSDLYYSYSTNQSLLDADIVLFQPDLSSYSLDYSSETYFQGKPCYDKNSSFNLQEDSLRWKIELSTALASGKTVFVFFKEYKEIYIHTGQKSFSGTGRNQRTTNMVTNYDNYKFFPITLPSIVSKQGEVIVFTGNSTFSTFWNELKLYLKYESYLDEKTSGALFLTKTGEKTLGALFKVGPGNLVLLPPFNYDKKKFERYDQKKKETFWTPDAIKFGKRLFKIFLDIDKVLKKDGERTPPPDLLNDKNFDLIQEDKIKTEIEEKSKQVDELLVAKNKLITELDNVVKIKDLLFEKGKNLENAIISALEILEYKAENFNDGNLELDQVILSPEGDRFIGEAEGKDNSSVNIDKLRQLSLNMHEDLQREEVSIPAIGILFGNGNRLKKPSEREEQFTLKCINVAKSSNIILIKTSDLFSVAKFIKETKNKEFAITCRTAIKNSLGKIVEFPPIL